MTTLLRYFITFSILLTCATAVVINSETEEDETGKNLDRGRSGSSGKARYFQTIETQIRYSGESHQKHGEIVHSAPTFQGGKRRSSGDFKHKRPKVHVGGVESDTRLLKHRFNGPVEVLPSLIEQELPFDFSDDTAPIEIPSAQPLPQPDFQSTETIIPDEKVPLPLSPKEISPDSSKSSDGFKKLADEMIKITFPSSTEIFKGFQYPKELKKKPAFCRRCFKFWRSVAINTPNALLLEYCCTRGQKKGLLRKKLLAS